MGKVRRSGRIAKEIRILLLGMDCNGTVFSEETQTVTLSRHGAGIISKHKLATDGLLIMRFSGGSTETAIRLVGQLGQDARGYVYGVAFVDEEEDFWELKFPPPPVWSVNLDGPMQCDSCKQCEVVDQSEVEADVFALSETILRYCIYCGMPTVWRRAPDGMVIPKLHAALDVVGVNAPALKAGAAPPSRSFATGPKPTAASEKRPWLPGAELLTRETLPEPALPPVASAVVGKEANRRKDVRTRVTFSACIRQGASEEIVECANLSRRGFAFRSRKVYPVGSQVEAAVPFYPGTPPSFVLGAIRHVTALPNRNFHYGVMYVSGATDVIHSGYELDRDDIDL
jgi:hypothetical protein